MSPLEAAVLGLVQGLTEFLPISSSGHLVLAQHLLGLKEPQLFFDVMVHLGTLIAVLAAFRQDIADLLRGRDPGTLLAIAIGSVPTAIIGLALKRAVEMAMTSVYLVAGMLAVTGLVLIASSRLSRGSEGRVDPLKALGIGVAQGLAVMPGISRSGLTISAGMLIGIRPDEAARFSFLLAIPAILGASALEAKDATASGLPLSSLLVGTSAALASGYAAIKLLISSLRRGRFQLFGYYCLLIASASALAELLSHRL